MGSVDKGLQPLRGEAMVAHVMRRLAPQVGALAINANQNLDAYAAFGAPVWPDDLTGFEGPLAGLETGLRRCGTELLVTAPCDSPFLPLDLVPRLLAAMRANGADLALAETEEPYDNGQANPPCKVGSLRGDALERTNRPLHPASDAAMRVQPHPVFALVKAAALPQLSAYLAGGGRRMDGWYGAIKVARVRFDDAAAFRNINTLRELRQFEEE